MYVVMYREKREVVILDSCYKNKKVSSKLKICLRMLIGKLQWGIKENISLKDINAPPKAWGKRWLSWFYCHKKVVVEDPFKEPICTRKKRMCLT